MARKITIASLNALISLGIGSSWLSVITSTILALISFFYVFTMGSYLKLSLYVLQNRIVYHRYFVDHYVINRSVDQLFIAGGTIVWLVISVNGRAKFAVAGLYGALIVIALLTDLQVLLEVAALLALPLVLLTFIINRLAPKKQILKTNSSSLLINYISLIGIVTGFAGLLTTFMKPLSVLSYSSSAGIANYSYMIFLLFSSFSPIFVFLMVFCIPVKLLICEITKRAKIESTVVVAALSDNEINLSIKVIFLSVFVTLSIAIGLIPNLNGINKENQLIGADTDHYVKAIETLTHSKSPGDFYRQSFVSLFRGDRPFALIILFVYSKLVPSDASFAIDHVPLILSPALVLVVYFFTRELTSNEVTSLIASFLTAMSFHSLVGIYAGFYANWIALIVGFVSLLFLFRFLKNCGKLNIILYLVFSILLMFTHVYTWTIFILTTMVFLGAVLKLNYYPRRSVFLLMLAIFLCIAIDFARMGVSGSGIGIEQDIRVARERETGFEQFNLRWKNLTDTTQFYYGAVFSNFTFYALGIYWLYRSKLNDPLNLFLVIILSTGIVPLFFGDWALQSKVLYDIPFQIPAAIGLTYIKAERRSGNYLLLAISIWLLANSVRTAYNFSR